MIDCPREPGFQKSERISSYFLRGKRIALRDKRNSKSFWKQHENEMKEENKFLNRSRERQAWRKKLAGGGKKEARADSIYFRPSLSDDKRIRELAEMTGETKNTIVEKLVAAALHNKTFTTQKLEQQQTALRRLEDKTGDVASGQLETLRLLEEILSNQTAQEKLTTSLLSEIFCMVHTAVSLVRTALLQILGMTHQETIVQSPAPQVLASFDETSDLTIARSLQDLENTRAHHQIKNAKFAAGNLFWKSKLRRADSAPAGE